MYKRNITKALLVCVFIVSTVIAGGQAGSKQYDKEIDKIANKKEVKKAFEFIREIEPQTLKDHITLAEIPATLHNEREKAEMFAKMLKKAGADSVWIDKVGNVIAMRKGTDGSRTVAIEGHIDTVFPEGTDFTVRISGDTMFAPGIGDDTRGLTVVLTVLQALEASGIETEANLFFIGTVGEEGLGDLYGTKYLLNESGLKIDSWISVDGGGLSGIVTRALGSVRYRINFNGPGGHSWGAFGYVNPAHALGQAISFFVEEADRFTSTGPKTSYNVGRIGGGTSINSVPYHAWAEVDMRSESPEKLDGIEAILLKSVRKALDEQNKMKRSGNDLKLNMEQVGRRPSGSTDPSTPLVQRAMAVSRFFDNDPELRIGSTNSNIPISKNIPAITIGRGGVGAKNHSLDEWWANIDGYKAIEYAMLVVMAEAGLSTF